MGGLNAVSLPLSIRRNWAIYLIAAAVIIAALPTLTYPLGRDQGEFATIGRGLLQGRIPYAELWNPKPPAVFYVYAAAMRIFDPAGTGSIPALRIIDLLIVPLCLLGLHAIAIQLFGERAGSRIGWVTAALFGAFYFTETFWTLTQNDGIVLLPMIAAVYATGEAARQGGYGRRYAIGYAALAGVCAAIVFWFKYPFVLFIAWLPVLYVFLRRATALRLDGWVVIAFTLALVISGGGFALYLFAIGAGPDLIESIRVTAGYAALGVTSGNALDWLVTALGFRWQHWGLLFALAAVGLALVIHRARTADPPDGPRRERLHGLVIIGWLAGGLAVLMVQAKGYDYHWLPMLPPLALLGGVGVVALADRLKVGDGHHLSLIIGLILLIPVLVVWPPVLTGQTDYVAGEFVAAESEAVAAYLRERTTWGDSLFIWGFRPEVYYRSGLNPATRYIFQFPLVGSWYPQEWRDDNVSLLWAALPPYVLILHGDYMPWVTGSAEDSATLLQAYEELNNWLMYNYERDAQIGTFQLWKRTASP